ncbi:MAG: SURF1 family protein [Paracoccaceae bacterium]
MILPLIAGVIGTAILLSLGTWQLQRMSWKQGVLAAIDARLSMPAIAVPADPDPVADKYLQVNVSGTLEPVELHVLGFGNGGPGFRVIAAMVLKDGRRILVDRGFIPETAKNTVRNGGAVIATGSMIWPQETDKYIAAPDRAKNIWFARNVPLMAETLGTLPLMVALHQSNNNQGITPQIPSINISNRHLEYVLTWYGLAIIWFGMTGYLLWRIKRKTV